MKKWNLNSML